MCGALRTDARVESAQIKQRLCHLQLRHLALRRSTFVLDKFGRNIMDSVLPRRLAVGLSRLARFAQRKFQYKAGQYLFLNCPAIDKLARTRS